MGTPCGRNWFWREYSEAANRSDTVAWQVPTLGVRVENERLVRALHPMENPDFTFAEAERLFQTMLWRSFEQEFLAEFIEDSGAVFRNVRAVSTAHEVMPIPGHVHVFGVDWGKSYDFTVISVIDVDAKRQVAMDRFNQIDYVFQVSRLRALYERWLPTDIVAESNAMGAPLVELLEREGLPVEAFATTRQSKARIIEALALAIERQDVTLLNDETQINELQAYDMKRLPSGSFTYGAPEGMHDDTVMALALAWHAVDISGPSMILI